MSIAVVLCLMMKYTPLLVCGSPYTGLIKQLIEMTQTVMFTF